MFGELDSRLSYPIRRGNAESSYCATVESNGLKIYEYSRNFDCHSRRDRRELC